MWRGENNWLCFLFYILGSFRLVCGSPVLCSPPRSPIEICGHFEALSRFDAPFKMEWALSNKRLRDDILMILMDSLDFQRMFGECIRLYCHQAENANESGRLAFERGRFVCARVDFYGKIFIIKLVRTVS